MATNEERKRMAFGIAGIAAMVYWRGESLHGRRLWIEEETGRINVPMADFTESNLMVRMGGQVAERLADGITPVIATRLRSANRVSSEACIVNLMRALHNGRVTRHRRLAVQERCREILQHPAMWQSVSEVAERLLEHTVVTGEEAEGIFERAGAAHKVHEPLSDDEVSEARRRSETGVHIVSRAKKTPLRQGPRLRAGGSRAGGAQDESRLDLPGRSLTDADLQLLEALFVPRGLAEKAMLRRLTHDEALSILNMEWSKNSAAGLLIPYVSPESSICGYRVRLDERHQYVSADGQPRLGPRYLNARGRPNMLYLVPQTEQLLTDASVPVILASGELKALACCQMALSIGKPLLTLGISGVWNWRGVIGYREGPRGEMVRLKGPIQDLGWITWQNRSVFLICDTPLNDSVGLALKRLTAELAGRGSQVVQVDIPAEAEVHGIHHLLAIWGADRVWRLFERAVEVGGSRRLDVEG